MPRRRSTRDALGRGVVRIRIGGVDHYLGQWTAEDAPLTRDRFRMHAGLEPREVVARARKTGAASAETLRAEALRTRPRRSEDYKYFGVKRDRGRGFMVCFNHRGEKYVAAGYRTERDAALAADRLARYVGRTLLNFPEKRLAPASLDELRLERTRERKSRTSSDFIGVVCSPNIERPWFFYLFTEHGEQGHVGVGGYSSQREAAIARDRAALHYGASLSLNFPEEARALGPATIDELRADIHRERKKTTSSQYRGVYRDKRSGCWMACITFKGVVHRLGSHEDEAVAARAYDDAILRLGDDERKLNFGGGPRVRR